MARLPPPSFASKAAPSTQGRRKAAVRGTIREHGASWWRIGPHPCGELPGAWVPAFAGMTPVESESCTTKRHARHVGDALSATMAGTQYTEQKGFAMNASLPGAESWQNAVNRGLPLREQALPEPHTLEPELHRRSACGQPRGMLDVGHRQTLHGVHQRKSRRQRRHRCNLGVRPLTVAFRTHRR